MYNVGVYYLEFPHWLQITFNNIANKTNQVPFFNCCHSQTLRKFQIINPHVIHPIASSPPPPLPPPPPPPPINPTRNLKNDPPQVGEFYLPPPQLSGGRTLRYRSYIYLFFIYTYHIFFELGWFSFRNLMEAQKHEIWIKEYDLPSRAFTVSKRIEDSFCAFAVKEKFHNFVFRR